MVTAHYVVFDHPQPFNLLGREAVVVARMLAEKPRVEILLNGAVKGRQFLVDAASVTHQLNESREFSLGLRRLHIFDGTIGIPNVGWC